MKSVKPLSNYDISSFCQQMHYLLQAGITPADGMDILLQDSSHSYMHELISQMKETCMQGERLSTAMQKTGRFPDYVMHMISLGEESGHLSSILLSLAQYYEREENIAESIRDAVRYPMIMIGMMLLVILTLIVKVLPIFNQVFSQLGAQMTGFALSLLHFSTVLSRYSFGLILVVAILVLVLFVISKSKAGRQYCKKLFSAFPFARNFSASVAAGRFASGMSLTLSSGLDTYESLDLIRELVENKEMETKISECRKFIEQGSTFADALKQAQIFTAFYTHMVLIGFRAGSLDSVMKEIASHYEDETDNKIRSFIATLEPTLVIILSLFVGLILLSVIMPLMGIMTMIG